MIKIIKLDKKESELIITLENEEGQVVNIQVPEDIFDDAEKAESYGLNFITSGHYR